MPIVLTSHTVMDWFGYSLPVPGVRWVGPVLGSVVFAYAGWPLLAGGLRDRAPGMMLLISMAIVVVYLASVATSLGAFDLDFWWELAAPVTIMLLGHWQEMRSVRRAGRSARWPPCCPTTPAGRGRSRWPTSGWATWCWSAPAAGCRPTGGSSRARPSWTSR